MEIKNNKDIKVIAFYLPQFHAIPENDKAHGKGFTEWTNVKKAKPLFEKHYQPRVPKNENYYNLLTEGVMEKQVNLAKENGIFGFCYYHYWFKDGKKLLEQPIENMLKNKSIDMPFCLSWANENWTKCWDGGDNEIIMEQDYGDESDWDKHIQYLIKFFKDERYITIDEQPLFLIYKPELIPNLKKMINYIRKRVKEYGFNGIKIGVQYPKYYCDNRKRSLFDYYIEFEPAFTLHYTRIERKPWLIRNIKTTLYSLNMDRIVKSLEYIKGKSSKAKSNNKLEIRKFDKDWKNILSRNINDNKMILGAFTDWDNTSRNKNGRVYTGSNPEKFRYCFSELIRKIKKEKKENIIFINAWNEWAEGAYLEPDEKYGSDYLKAINKALKDNN